VLSWQHWQALRLASHANGWGVRSMVLAVVSRSQRTPDVADEKRSKGYSTTVVFKLTHSEFAID
jgi:hypothetical protein